MKTKIILLFALCFFLTAHSQVTKTLNVTTAGTLSTLLTPTELSSVTNLNLTGNIDARDVKTMRENMHKLAVLDISAVSIKAYSGPDGTNTYSSAYSANEMPVNSFWNGATDIGKTSLKTIILPLNITSIGYAAFYLCSGIIGNLNIPSTVTTIGSQAFSYCSGFTGTLSIPASITTIENSTFSGCKGFTGSFNVPSTVTSIGASAFSDCGLSAINIDASNQIYSSVDGVLFNKDKTTLIVFPGGKAGAYIVPNTTTNITADAFRGCSELTSLTIPKSCNPSIQLIGIDKLTFLKISSEFFNGNDYFAAYEEYCPKSLNTIIVDEGILNVNGSKAICGLFRTLKSLDLSAAENTTLPTFAMLDLNELTTLKLPSALTSIPYKGLAECVSLDSVFIPSTVTEIGMRAFENCRSLRSVGFGVGSQLTTIDNWAFYACHGLKNIVIPSGVSTIGAGAFWGCNYLESVQMPASLMAIKDNGFDGCVAMKSMRVEASTPPVVDANTFSQVNKNITVAVPPTSLALYKAAYGWKDFFNIKAIGAEGLTMPIEMNYTVSVNDRNISIFNATNAKINIFDVSGRIVFATANANSTENFAVNNVGIYILRVGDSLQKLVVR